MPPWLCAAIYRPHSHVVAMWAKHHAPCDTSGFPRLDCVFPLWEQAQPVWTCRAFRYSQHAQASIQFSKSHCSHHGNNAHTCGIHACDFLRHSLPKTHRAEHPARASILLPRRGVPGHVRVRPDKFGRFWKLGFRKIKRWPVTDPVRLPILRLVVAVAAPYRM